MSQDESLPTTHKPRRTLFFGPSGGATEPRVTDLQVGIPHPASPLVTADIFTPSSPTYPASVSSLPTGIEKKKQRRTLKFASIMTKMSGYPNAHQDKPRATGTDEVELVERHPQSPTSSSHTPDLHRIASTSASSSSSNVKSVRVVGRGGIGSKPRAFSTSPNIHSPNGGSKLDLGHSVSTSRSATSLGAPRLLNKVEVDVSKSKVRFVGRGGSGSRHRKAAQKAAETAPPSIDTRRSMDSHDSNDQASLVKTFRMSGRGGAASRPRPANNAGSKGDGEPSILARKGKGKELTKRPSISNFFSQRLANDSSSTINDVRYAANADLKPLASPASSSFPPSHEQSTSFPHSPHSSVSEGYNGTPISSPSSFSSDSLLTPSSLSPQLSRQRNLNKIAKTLGDLPPHVIYENLINRRRAALPTLPKLATDKLTQVSSSKKNRSANPKRASISISSLSSLSSLFRPSPSSDRNGRDTTSLSQHSMSTLSDDLHQFGLADDLSESWGEVRDEPKRASTSDSPITFSPPTPVVIPSSPPLSSAVLDPGSDADVSYQDQQPEPETDTPTPSPTTTLHHAHPHFESYPHSSPPGHESVPHHHFPSHLHSPSSVFSEVSNKRVVDRDFAIPDTSGDVTEWMNPLHGEDIILLTRSPPEPMEVWTGEWNGSISDIIHGLRMLR